MRNAVTTTSVTSQASPFRSSHTLYCLIGFYSLIVVWGIHHIDPERAASRLDFLTPIAFAVCLGSWLIVDAHRRGHPIPMLSQSWACLFAAIIVPVYLVWSRKWRGLGWLVLNAFLACTLFVATILVGQYLVHGFAPR